MGNIFSSKYDILNSLSKYHLDQSEIYMLRSLIRNKHMFIIMDLNKNVLHADKNFLSTINYSKTEFTNIMIKNVFENEAFKKITFGKKSYAIKLLCYTKQANRFYNHLYISPIYNFKKEIILYIAIIIKIDFIDKKKYDLNKNKVAPYQDVQNYIQENFNKHRLSISEIQIT